MSGHAPGPEQSTAPPEAHVTIGNGRVCIVTFYAIPAIAIGGRRPSSLAVYLSSCGQPVDLFTSVPAAVCETGGPCRVVIRDRRTGARLLSAVARLVRLIRGRRPAAEASGRAGRAIGTNARRFGLRDRIYQVLDVIDNCKAWSCWVFLRVVWRGMLRRPAVIVVSGPPFSPMVAATLAALVLKVPLVLDFRDPWVGGSSGPSRLIARWRSRVERAAEAFCVRRATGIVSTTHGIGREISERWAVPANRFYVVPNGFDPDAVIDEPAPTGRLSLLFAGTIYLNRNPLNLLDALAVLAADPGVRREALSLRFVGDCARWEGTPLVELVASRGLRDIVAIDGEVSRETVLALTREANVLVNLAQGQRMQVPGKLFEQAATKRAVLLVTEADSASAEIARGVRSIYVVDDDAGAIAAVLRALYRSLVVDGDCQSLASATVDRMSRAHSNQAFAQIIRAATDTGAGGRPC
jgi:glycosyltransferase involved in cell wall biosynthesis